MSAALLGLVLAGGASTRMRRDKAALAYHGKPQLQWTYELLTAAGIETFVSVRADQQNDAVRAGYPLIVDCVAAAGPIAGILSALQTHPDSAWLVLACDLPFIDRPTLQYLLARRDPTRVATAYRSAHDNLPEPLCAIFEPRARGGLEAAIAVGRLCPRKFLSGSDALLLDLPDARALDNVNTPEEWTAATEALSPSPHERGERAGVSGSTPTPSPHASGERAGVRGSS